MFLIWEHSYWHANHCSTVSKNRAKAGRSCRAIVCAWTCFVWRWWSWRMAKFCNSGVRRREAPAWPSRAVQINGVDLILQLDFVTPDPILVSTCIVTGWIVSSESIVTSIVTDSRAGTVPKLSVTTADHWRVFTRSEEYAGTVRPPM